MALDVEQGICFSLNPVGLRIWESLKRQFSLDQIVDALAQEFSVPRSQLLSDAVEFIEALEGMQLVRRLVRRRRPSGGLRAYCHAAKKLGPPLGARTALSKFIR